MTTPSAPPPSKDFSGMLYAPDAEVAVYLLMGLLWNHLPYRLAFEAFELNPNREGHTHTKFLDAKGKLLAEGVWKDVTIEFKLYSSGLVRDLAKHPGLSVNLLVCWIHDDPSVEAAVDMILELHSVFRSLPADEQSAIILHPDVTLSRCLEPGNVGDLLGRFSEQNQDKVRELIDMWPQVKAGSAEVMFLRGKSTVLRACKYSSEHLIVCIPPPGFTLKKIVEEFGGEELQYSARLPLNDLEPAEIGRLVKLLQG